MSEQPKWTREDAERYQAEVEAAEKAEAERAEKDIFRRAFLASGGAVADVDKAFKEDRAEAARQRMSERSKEAREYMKYRFGRI